MNDFLGRLAERMGIDRAFHDIWGNERVLSEASLIALLDAMGVDAETPESCEAALRRLDEAEWARPLPPVLVVRDFDGTLRIPVRLAKEHDGARFTWALTREDGREVRDGFRPRNLPVSGEFDLGGKTIRHHALDIGIALSVGYHAFELTGPGIVPPATLRVIVAPPRCHVLPAWESGAGKTWGLAVQTFSLQSRRNWGMGDFTDLVEVARRTAPKGVGVIGVNPLHALFPSRGGLGGPYSPSERRFLNVLYIDVEAVPDFAECAPAREWIDTGAFDERRAQLQARDLVAFDAVGVDKIRVLELLFRSFAEKHLAADDGRAEDFRRFCRQGGVALDRLACFDALCEHFGAEKEWTAWPEPFQDPESEAVAEFREANAERLEFFRYLQWEADRQLAATAAACAEAGMPVGLYGDLALGPKAHSAEVWGGRRELATSVHLGAPPDAFSPFGQEWGVVPFDPNALREAAYEPYIALLRANMRHFGAMRLDHAMMLQRQFWVPAGGSPADGGYVRFPLQDLLGIVALESARNACVVIAEDLGTVPEGFRDRLAEISALSYKVFYFERDWNGGGDFYPPKAYPMMSLATPTTHDLATLTGFWRGYDLEVRRKLQRFESEEKYRQAQEERVNDRAKLLAALRHEGLWNDDRLDNVDVEALIRQVARLVARTGSAIAMIPLEDALGLRDQVNLPGTTDQHPNWKRHVPDMLDEWIDSERFDLLAQAMNEERPG